MQCRITRLLLCLAFLGTVRADDISLIGPGDEWRIHYGATAPPDAWRNVAFSDEDWPRAIAGFSTTGAEASYLAGLSSSYAAVFFRGSFDVADPADIAWLILRIDYEDGFVAYLNGAEVARRFMAGDPGSIVAHTEFSATTHFRGVPEEIDLSHAVSQVRAGTNILAVQLHRSSAFDSSLGMLPELRANFSRGPYVQNTSTGSTQIIWRTLAPSDARIEFGANDVAESGIYREGLETNHVVTLTGLAPGTAYQYRVTSSAGGQSARSSVRTFRTLKSAGNVRLAVLADSGLGSAGQYGVARVLEQLAPDLVVHAGDIAYPSFGYATADTRFLSVYARQLRTTPFYMALGNHDIYYDGLAAFFETFYLPTNSVNGREDFYSFDQGDAHCAVLNITWFAAGVPKPGDPQQVWLANDLAASRKPWKFLFLHHPLKSSSYHGSDDYDRNGVLDVQEVSAYLLPLAKACGVQMIFSSHDHDYERFAPEQGVTCIVTGGGGGYLYSLSRRQPGSAQFYSRFHCVLVETQGDVLKLGAYDATGQLFDSMTLARSLPPNPTFTGAWHSPILDTSGAPDGDGNFAGQSFELKGEPVLTLSGDASNLGLLYVNRDRTNLYLGFAQTMIYPEQLILLFVEIPGLAGVTNLAGLGDGPANSTAGVESLDNAENLSFLNFAPSIACVVGDELADSPARDWARPGSPLPLGQGVFRLNPALDDLPGATLQQFNRSPQDAPVAGEQNADFMMVTIPWAALGHPRGDTVRVGAVVARGFDTNTQSAHLDSSYAGLRLLLEDDGSAILEGVPVQLAPDPDGDPSRFRLSARWLSADKLRVGWFAAAGRLYTLQWSAEPDREYVDVADATFPFIGQDADAAFELALPDAPRRFFRMLATPVDPRQ